MMYEVVPEYAPVAIVESASCQGRQLCHQTVLFNIVVPIPSQTGQFLNKGLDVTDYY